MYVGKTENGAEQQDLDCVEWLCKDLCWRQRPLAGHNEWRRKQAMHSRKAVMTAYKEIAIKKAIGCQHKDYRDEELLRKLCTQRILHTCFGFAKDALAKRGSDGTRP